MTVPVHAWRSRGELDVAPRGGPRGPGLPPAPGEPRLYAECVTEEFPPQLHDLEREVMQEVWRRERASVREVLETLNAGERQRAYTTVMTTMCRLYDKGLLRRERHGKADVYEPALSADDYRRTRAAREVEALVGQYGDAALAHFARHVEELDPARLTRLRKLADG